MQQSTSESASYIAMPTITWKSRACAVQILG